jgi:hypothetical protein
MCVRGAVAFGEGTRRTAYEDGYCPRGDAENRIKEQKYLFAGSLPYEQMRANQSGLYQCSFAYMLCVLRRRFGLEGTEMSQVQCPTIRHAWRLPDRAGLRRGENRCEREPCGIAVRADGEKTAATEPETARNAGSASRNKTTRPAHHGQRTAATKNTPLPRWPSTFSDVMRNAG